MNIENKAHKRVGIWIRVSTDMQVKDESPEHHEHRARSYTDHKGWEVVELYQLGAFSGKSIKDHPEAKRMLADIASGHITGLVFSKLARLARNTKELLEFAEIFRQHNADLVSLAESIDTSSPAGRLFFTIIAAMAQWEREEIASRVSASVPIRAKLGKSLGGQPSFGYKWENNTFVIDEHEAPIRKLLYELFIKHQRKLATAKALNARGFRTRNGSHFSATTVGRLLRDTTAKGERRANYTKTSDDTKAWQLKPKEEWIIIPCEPVVSAQLWNECNAILDVQESKHKRPGPTPVRLLSGMVQCSCGKPMYVFHKSLIYACKACKSRISVDDIDDIYQVHLKDYLQNINHADYLNQHDEQLQSVKRLLDNTQKERNRLSKRMTDMLNLRLDGEMSKDQFGEQYKPLEMQVAQLDKLLPELEAEIDVRNIQMLSNDAIMQEATTLYEKWADMQLTEKRAIVETITTGIIVGKEDIEIKFAYAPLHSLNAGNSTRDVMGSCWPPA